MIELKITVQDKRALITTARFLMELAGAELVTTQQQSVETTGAQSANAAIALDETATSGKHPAVDANAAIALDPSFEITPVPEPPQIKPVLNIAPAVIEPDTRELDIDGFPWDARIHARTQVKDAEGRWKLKRGAPNELIKRVRAEAKIPRPSVPAPAADMTTDDVLRGLPADDVDESYNNLTAYIGSMLAAKKLNGSKIFAVLDSCGLESLLKLKEKHALIPLVRQKLEVEATT